LLLESGWPGKVNLKLLCGGEALELTLAQQLLNSGAELWNLYGPTETTIWSAALKLEAATLADGFVPIGPPIANTQFQVLDAQQCPVPLGVPGELYIGGLGLSAGYWQREDLTKERFVDVEGRRQKGIGNREQGTGSPQNPERGQNPSTVRLALTMSSAASSAHAEAHSPIHPSILYKTGDRVRPREDGTLEYLGRLDHQVKLRGFRIELGEIEAVLTQHPNVSQAVVVLREDNTGEPQLIAYVAKVEGNREQGTGTREQGEPRTQNLEPNNQGRITKNLPSALPHSPTPPLPHFLSPHLPAYMVPAQFVVLEALPLTPNGKVDRNALPKPKSTETTTATAPSTPTEELLANIWSRVLGQWEISRDHHFFELGGHSLLVTRVVAQVRQVFGVELPVRSLFEHPTLSQLAAAIDTLKAGDSPATLASIQPIERAGALPLADAQQRQWVLAQLEPESPFYIIPTAVRVKGGLSIDRLQQSLAHLIDRHEVLRTAFKDVEGQAVIELQAEVETAILLVDLSDLDEARQREQVREQIQQAARTPFDLGQAPLLRMKVLRLAAADYAILLSLHHIIADGWSMGVLVRELVQVYDALPMERSIALPLLPIQYVDYAAWQQQQAEHQQPSLAYWQAQLQGVPPLLELPTDYPRPAVQSFAGAAYTFRLSPTQTQALQALSQQQGVTLFMTLLAAFQVLLHRCSGVEDLVIGTPIANRPRAELEGLIGLFVNTLVLRTAMSGNPSFEELLGRVRAVALDAYAHQSVPFEQVVEALAVPRSWSHAPLFQVMFVWQNAAEAIAATEPPISTLSDTALEWQPLPIDSSTAKVDLTLSMRLDERGLQGTLEYRTDLFTADTIHRLAGYLRQLLKIIPQQPTRRIAELPLLTQAEQQQLWQWQQTQADYPADLGLHQLFERQVKQTPAAIALITGDQRLSYQALNQRANQLAHYLQAHHIGPETLVGVCLERTADLVVALLAILKAGGAYVPLDPAYPAERLAFILQDAQVTLLLTSQATAIATPASLPQLTVAALKDTLSQFPKTNPAGQSSADHLAYVIYTSGSTGRPKGVAIEHHSPVALCSWAQTVFSLEQLSGVLAGTSLCFDLSIFELFVPLSCGGTVILAENVLQLPELAVANAVTLVNTVPSAIAALLRIGGIPGSVTTINLAGEPLPPALVPQLYQLPHIQHVYNLYGPSEDTTYSTYARMQEQLETVSIGRPIANTQAHVLDAYRQPVPIGVPGELYLGGAGLARGYLNRPELTAERFVPNPFYGKAEETREQGTGNGEQGIGDRGQEESGIQSPERGQNQFTLYKTGDRVRYRPDGTLEFLDRLDNQVKIRGFRIELGEIETALLSHPEIEQAVVNPWTDENGTQRLVAYVVQKGTGNREQGAGNREQGTGNREQAEKERAEFSVSSSQFDAIQISNLKTQNSSPPPPISPSPHPGSAHFRSFLADQLPDYMLPSCFMLLDDLPRLPNGKRDRQTLPIPTVLAVAAQDSAPMTATEATLAAIWTELLPVAQVGMQDNFFALGGDSILALQAIAKAHQQGLHLTPKDLFQQQTIARLATVVSSRTQVPAEQGLVTGTGLLTPIQHWFFEQTLKHPHHWNQALLLEVRQPMQPLLLEQALARLLEHHDALRASFGQTAAGWQQQWQAPGPVSLTVVSGPAADLPGAIAETTRDLQTGFDLATGPLLQVAYFDFEEEHRLLLVCHHLGIDGVSWRILLADLRLVYGQLEQGQTVQLPAKTTAFKQWAEQLHAYARTPTLAAESAYWQSLAATPMVPLPRDFASADNRQAIADRVTVSLSEADTRRLLQEVPGAYPVQINDLLLTALVLAFEPWTGTRRLRLELEGHGREALPGAEATDIDLTRTVGWFTTLFPVALDLTATPTLGTALKQVKETLRAVPHRGLGYGVGRYLHLDAWPSAAAAVRFNYLGQLDQVWTADERFAPASETTGAARSAEDARPTLLEIDGLVSRGQLQLHWAYSTAIHRRATIASLAEGFVEVLRQLIEHCLTTDEDDGYTPSDFPQMSLSQDELDDLLADL
ncbi:MAG: amino acid adenylation domain-containing protein, partial [Leptolyngbyaceae cyanobacterium]